MKYTLRPIDVKAGFANLPWHRKVEYYVSTWFFENVTLKIRKGKRKGLSKDEYLSNVGGLIEDWGDDE